MYRDPTQEKRHTLVTHYEFEDNSRLANIGSKDAYIQGRGAGPEELYRQVLVSMASRIKHFRVAKLSP